MTTRQHEIQQDRRKEAGPFYRCLRVCDTQQLAQQESSVHDLLWIAGQAMPQLQFPVSLKHKICVRTIETRRLKTRGGSPAALPLSEAQAQPDAGPGAPPPQIAART